MFERKHYYTYDCIKDCEISNFKNIVLKFEETKKIKKIKILPFYIPYNTNFINNLKKIYIVFDKIPIHQDINFHIIASVEVVNELLLITPLNSFESEFNIKYDNLILKFYNLDLVEIKNNFINYLKPIDIKRNIISFDIINNINDNDKIFIKNLFSYDKNENELIKFITRPEGHLVKKFGNNNKSIQIQTNNLDFNRVRHHDVSKQIKIFVEKNRILLSFIITC